MDKEEMISCPYCGSEMEPVCEERKILTGLFRKTSFYTIYMRCTKCGAQGPSMENLLNQEEGLLAAAQAAAPMPTWAPFDRYGIVKPERLPALGVKEMEELAHLWHAAREGRVSVWPVKPGERYWRLSSHGENKYTEEGDYIGQDISFNLMVRQFRPGQTWDANDFATRAEAIAAAERRWPGVQVTPANEVRAVQTSTGLTENVTVPNGNMTGKIFVKEDRPGVTKEQLEGEEDALWNEAMAKVNEQKEQQIN